MENPPPLVTFFRGERSNEMKEIKRMEQKIRFYYLMGGEMYRRTLLSTDAKCLGPKKALLVLCEAHEGGRAEHAGARALARKVVRAGFY